MGYRAKKLLNISVAIVYSIVYDYVYRNYVSVVCGYMNERENHEMNSDTFLFYLFITVFPFVFFKGTKTVASVYSFFMYILVYIPVINALFVYGFPNNVRDSVALPMLLMMTISFLTDKKTILKHLVLGKSKIDNIKPIEAITVIMFLVLIALNHSQMHFANIAKSSELYGLREKNDISLVYFMCWLRSVFVPLLLILYLKNKCYIKYALGMVAYILLFMLDKQKITLVYPFLLTGIYYALTRKKMEVEYFYFIIFGVFTIIPLFLLAISSENLLLHTISVIFIMRTMCIAGMETERYVQFFMMEDNPYTYYTHINFVGTITGAYPYNESIGQVVAGDGSNSNATFWMMDGIAAAGIMGIIIGIVFILFKSLMNSIGIKCSMVVAIPILMYSIQAMANVSIFTSMITHGAILIYLVFLFLHKDIFMSTKEDDLCRK